MMTQLSSAPLIRLHPPRCIRTCRWQPLPSPLRRRPTTTPSTSRSSRDASTRDDRKVDGDAFGETFGLLRNLLFTCSTTLFVWRLGGIRGDTFSPPASWSQWFSILLSFLYAHCRHKLWALCCVIVASWCTAVLQAPASCSCTFSAGPYNPSCAQHLRGAVGGWLPEPSATSFVHHCPWRPCCFFIACASARECALGKARPLSPRCCLDSRPENLRTDRGPIF